MDSEQPLGPAPLRSDAEPVTEQFGEPRFLIPFVIDPMRIGPDIRENGVGFTVEVILPTPADIG
jgi:hypothetical protein